MVGCARYAILVIGVAACGSGNSITVVEVNAGTERVWRPSYVMLFGRDPGVPSKAPADCARLATVEIENKGEKAYRLQPFRTVAQRVGGNGVTNIELLSDTQTWWSGRRYRYRGTVVHCPDIRFNSDSVPAISSKRN